MGISSTTSLLPFISGAPGFTLSGQVVLVLESLWWENISKEPALWEYNFCLQYPSLDLLHGSGAGITPLEKLKMMGGEITTLKGGVFVHEKLVSTRTGRSTSDPPVAIRSKVLTLGSLRGLHLGFTTTFSPTFGNLL